MVLQLTKWPSAKVLARTLLHLATGLLHYSTSHASTVLLMATMLLYNTNHLAKDENV